MAGYVGPVLLENGLAERVDFAEGDGFKSAGSFEPEAEAADSREQVEDFEFAIHRPPPVAEVFMPAPRSTSPRISGVRIRLSEDPALRNTCVPPLELKQRNPSGIATCGPCLISTL